MNVNPDNIKDPKHYSRWKIEPVQFMMENDIPYVEGNIIKYIMRWRYKGGLEDLHKAQEYLNILIKNELENSSD
jgi:hypothetical protein